MKTALITGGSRGIGAAVARRLAADGYRVAINYRASQTQAETLAGELGGIALQADVSDPLQVRRMVDTVLEKFCQLDILVCNAGVAWQGLLQDMTDGDWRRVMGTDLDGVFYCCRAVLPQMIRQKQGKIVTVSSMWGQVGASCEGPTSLARALVKPITAAFAAE